MDADAGDHDLLERATWPREEVGVAALPSAWRWGGEDEDVRIDYGSGGDQRLPAVRTRQRGQCGRTRGSHRLHLAAGVSLTPLAASGASTMAAHAAAASSPYH